MHILVQNLKYGNDVCVNLHTHRNCGDVLKKHNCRWKLYLP